MKGCNEKDDTTGNQNTSWLPSGYISEPACRFDSIIKL